MNANTALQILNREVKVSKSEEAIIKRWRGVYYGISLHTTGACPAFKNLNGGGTIYPDNYFGPEYQRIFNDFLMSRHPREADVTRNWRFSQYKPLTRAPFQQLIRVISGAIFQDSNYSVSIQDQDDFDYIINQNNFDDNHLMGWFASVGIQSMLEDPNGFFVRMPSKPFYEQKSKKLEVEILFVKSKDVVSKSEKHILFKRDGFAFFIDDRTIWRYTLDSDTNKYYISKNDALGYYAHLFGRLPLDVAGGVWNTQGFYDSYIQDAKPVADEYISSYSAEQMIDKEASHPFIQIASEECPSCEGIGRYTDQYENELGEIIPEQKVCKQCNGRGIVSFSPADRIEVPSEKMNMDLVKIINPDVGVNKYHHDKNRYIYERILHALNLYRTDKAESGEAKAIDQERLYMFISTIANHIFDKIAYNTIYDFISYRNVSSINGQPVPSAYGFGIVKPTQYQIKTAADLMEEFTASGGKALPAFIRNKMIFDIVDKQYSGDNVMKRKAEIILGIDDLAAKTDEEKMNMRLSGEITADDLVFSRKLPSLVDKMIRDKGETWFLEQSADVIESEILVRFQPFKTVTNFIDAPDYTE